MYKIIKDNKIISVLETNTVVGLNYDTIEQDTEHNIDDYVQYNGEYLLLADIPVPTREEQNEAIKQTRANLYAELVDPLHAERQRKVVLGTWTEEMEAEYVAEVKQLTEKIQTENPYIE